MHNLFQYYVDATARLGRYVQNIRWVYPKGGTQLTRNAFSVCGRQVNLRFVSPAIL